MSVPRGVDIQLSLADAIAANSMDDVPWLGVRPLSKRRHGCEVKLMSVSTCTFNVTQEYYSVRDDKPA